MVKENIFIATEQCMKEIEKMINKKGSNFKIYIYKY